MNYNEEPVDVFMDATTVTNIKKSPLILYINTTIHDCKESMSFSLLSSPIKKVKLSKLPSCIKESLSLPLDKKIPKSIIRTSIIAQKLCDELCIMVPKKLSKFGIYLQYCKEVFRKGPYFVIELCIVDFVSLYYRENIVHKVDNYGTDEKYEIKEKSSCGNCSILILDKLLKCLSLRLLLWKEAFENQNYEIFQSNKVSSLELKVKRKHSFQSKIKDLSIYYINMFINTQCTHYQCIERNTKILMESNQARHFYKTLNILHESLEKGTCFLHPYRVLIAENKIPKGKMENTFI